MYVRLLVYMCISVHVLRWLSQSKAVLQKACSDQTFSLECNYASNF